MTPQPPIAAGDRFPIVAGESSAPESGLPALSDAARGRLQAMFRDQYTFIWRVLRRLGVAPEDVDDAAQQVFMVAARRMEDIDAGSERAFLFGSALRIATGARRGRASRLASDDTALEVQVDPGPSPEQITERKRALQVLDEVLDAMPFELRTVFVLFELEGMSMQDIAQALELPRGTVASRLRRAREEFHGHAARLRARAQFRGGQP